MSGIGDRLSAWLAICALARLLGRTVVMPDTAWSERTSGHVLNQERDLRSTPICLQMPPYVHRVPKLELDLRPTTPAWVDRTHGLLVVRFVGGLFKQGIALSKVVRGFPQWAIPSFARVAFARHHYELHNLTVGAYLHALRGAAAEMRVRAECVPTASWLPSPSTRLVSGSHGHIRADAAEARAENERVVCLHLRRSDAFAAVAAHSQRSTLALTDSDRHAFDNRTRATVRALVRHFDAALMRVTWMVMSDDMTAARAYEHTILQANPRAQSVQVVPDGAAVYSLLAMRHVHGIVQSTLRSWSAFSALPAIAAGVPLLSVHPGRHGAIPHTPSSACEGVEHFAVGKSDELKRFAQRVVVGRGEVECRSVPLRGPLL